MPRGSIAFPVTAQRHDVRRSLGRVLLALAIIGVTGLVAHLVRDNRGASRGGAVPAASAIYLGIYAPGKQQGRYDTAAVGRRESAAGGASRSTSTTTTGPTRFRAISRPPIGPTAASR